MIFSRALGDTLRHCLEQDPRVVVLGEDIADPYGGAFKVTRGLSTDFPSRVLTTPIRKAAIAGLSGGLALSGYRPIAEIMFGDFLGLCFDQVINHISKYEHMYNGKATCPVIIRSPSGGGRGYGPTHSQSLEKFFLGIPHLRVVAASPYTDPKLVFGTILEGTDPVLYVEHKALYPANLELPTGGRIGDCLAAETPSSSGFPVLSLSMVPQRDCRVTVMAYGHQATVARSVIENLAVEDEIFCELLVFNQISPMDWEPVERSVNVTGALVTVEEGTEGWGWGSEAAATIQTRCFRKLRAPVEVVASKADVIASAKELEGRTLIAPGSIEAAIRRAAQ